MLIYTLIYTCHSQWLCQPYKNIAMPLHQRGSPQKLAEIATSKIGYSPTRRLFLFCFFSTVKCVGVSRSATEERNGLFRWGMEMFSRKYYSVLSPAAYMKACVPVTLQAADFSFFFFFFLSFTAFFFSSLKPPFSIQPQCHQDREV